MAAKFSRSRLKHLTSLKQKKYRQLHQKFIVEGLRICEEAVRSTYRVDTVFYTDRVAENDRGRRLIRAADKTGIETLQVSDIDLSRFTDSINSQGVAAVVQIPEPPPVPIHWLNTSTLLALDAVADPGNLGTIVRVADWFGLDGILLGVGCVGLFNPKLIRSTAGSVFHLQIYEKIDLTVVVHGLKKSGFRVCAGDAHDGVSIHQYNRPEKFVLVMGNEPHGIRPEIKSLVDDFLHIPKIGQAESLNVATATAILLFSLTNPNTIQD